MSEPFIGALIPLAEECPPKQGEYLIWTPVCGFEIATWSFCWGKVWRWTLDFDEEEKRACRITHWACLPKDPGVVEE